MAGDLITSIVLAGGKGRRLGKNKLLEVVGGRPLLQRVVDSLSPISRRILVVSAQGQEQPRSRGKTGQGRLHTGRLPRKGRPGRHLHRTVNIRLRAQSGGSRRHALLESRSGCNTWSALRLLSTSSCPGLNGQIEPLHAVYSRDCLPAIQEQLERSQLQIRVFLDKVRVRYVEEAEIDRFDPRHLSFFNVNTPDDLRKRRRSRPESGVPEAPPGISSLRQTGHG